MKNNQKRTKFVENKKYQKLPLFLAIVTGFLSGVVIPFSIFYFTVLGSDIRATGDQRPIFKYYQNGKINNNGHESLLVFSYRFKNYGLNPGFIDRVEIKPVNNDNEEMATINVQYINKSLIHWREVKDIRCEIVISIKNYGNKLFRIFYYDNLGREVFDQTFNCDFYKKGGPPHDLPALPE